jgi:hypothetical protein
MADEMDQEGVQGHSGANDTPPAARIDTYTKFRRTLGNELQGAAPQFVGCGQYGTFLYAGAIPGEYPIFVWEAADGGRMAMKGRSGSMAMSKELFKEFGDQPNVLKCFWETAHLNAQISARLAEEDAIRSSCRRMRENLEVSNQPIGVYQWCGSWAGMTMLMLRRGRMMIRASQKSVG